MSANDEVVNGLPDWAVELGLNQEIFSLLVREAFTRGMPPIAVAREWIAEMASKMVA